MGAYRGLGVGPWAEILGPFVGPDKAYSLVLLLPHQLLLLTIDHLD